MLNRVLLLQALPDGFREPFQEAKTPVKTMRQFWEKTYTAVGINCGLSFF